MRVLLLSTYELGHQPLGIAVPAAALEAAGHETRCVDLSVSAWPATELAWADAAALSVPMHTAARLGLEVLESIRSRRPGVPVAVHGLYAAAVASSPDLRPGDLLVAGDPVRALLEWAGNIGRGAASAPPSMQVDLGPRLPSPGPVTLRRDLPPLASYARLLRGGQEVPAASLSASSGCNHTCRHCPVAAVYHGRSRPVPVENVLADADQLVAMGAGHLSFADPDFLNRPRHAMEVALAIHEAHPHVTFDATVKVEHILRHAASWPRLAQAGLIFVVSAFESVDDRVLEILEKGHTAAEELEAVRILRSAGVEVRPSWLPFTPWTTPGSFGELLEFSQQADLVASTDPVQYSIRLLLPPGSLLLDELDPVLAASLTGGDALSSGWVSPLDGLQAAVAARAEEGEAAGEPAEDTFAAIWDTARASGVPLDPAPPEPVLTGWLPGAQRPRLSEAWFCCAEPTALQYRGLGAPGALQAPAVDHSLDAAAAVS